jgi:hypothetical protein
MDALLSTGLIRVLLLPAIALLFALLPIKVAPKRLIHLAFLLWLVGGVSLLVAGANRLTSLPSESLMTPMVIGGLVLAVIIGLAKGRFVLSKTSARNVQRINEMTTTQKLANVYSMRSWITIELMLVLSAALTWFAAPVLIRGIVNIGVGLALIASSRVYLGSAQQASQSSTQTMAS